jgi:hypothetical protein
VDTPVVKKTSDNKHVLKGNVWPDYTLIKIFLIYKEIQMGSGAKSYMRKGFLIYEEMHKYFHPKYEEVASHFVLDPSEFPNI